MKIAYTYNCDIRHNGTAFYVEAALEQLYGDDAFFVRAPHSDPPPADLYLYVDDGRDDIKWIPPRPNAYWAIDTHLGYGYRLWKAKQFDTAFVAQKDAVSRFLRDGVRACEWLPLACSPDHHLDREELLERGRTAEELEQNLDFSFVGLLNDPQEKKCNSRIDYLDRLFAEFRNSWLSTGVFFEEMCVRFARSKATFNISIKQDLNMRVFEAMSCGVPLLTNRNVEGIGDFFTEGAHYFGYEGQAEMIQSASRLMETSPKDRRAMAKQSQELVRSRHTYQHRVEDIVKRCLS